ncbi:MAG: hypothetical protein HOG85_05670 [Flavobacteriales bacterium]|jgi:antitoxin component YwqK of YwqJK toxin-antitoxin module|nr:hypothetical protein [Flavobacteriales bacterium]
MIRKIITLLILISSFSSISQNTYDFEGRLTSDQTFDKEGNLERTQKYFYNIDALTHELWYNSEDKLVVRYNYNKIGNVIEIIKYSPWEKEVTITDREGYYYDKKNMLIFSLYTDSYAEVTEKIYNSRIEEMHKIHYNKKITVESILKSRKDGQHYKHNKGYQLVRYTNNVIKEEGFYENKMKEGYWVYYYNNGETKEEGVYYMGEKNETWSEFNKEGNQMKQSEWYDGNLQSEICWDKNNKRIKCK